MTDELAGAGIGAGGGIGLAGAALPAPPAVQMTGPQKVAALLITLRTQGAAAILSRLPQEAVDQVAAELLATPSVGGDVRSAVLEEAAATVGGGAGGDLAAGQTYARELFQEAFGEAKGALLLDKIHQTLVVRPFEFLRSANALQLAELLATEHPQTIAVVLAHLEPRVAARILVSLEPALQVDVARRIAQTDQTSPEAIHVVEAGIRRRMTSVLSDRTTVGGTRPLAHVLNQVDRSAERQILSALGQQDPELADEVRRFMFVFEDVALLDDRAMQRAIRDIDTKDIALALRMASEEIRDLFFRNMSQRAAEMLREEMSLAGQVRLKNVEEAQGRIVQVVKKLEDEDEIVISRGGGDDALV